MSTKNYTLNAKNLASTSIITCPDCMHHAIETMPQDACVYLYECRNCQKLITPQQGDCCVFCSHGNQPCPTSQRDKKAYAEMTPASEEVTESISVSGL
ncbi:GDCCVxC domain-containing (seleno)protein [Endozoicomonas atrinae]|uniref:GDCCVxC domain-containing (seleno)protein n=1 Tax=Endozoicomonas atrinae TaxID=1333660 RepID=UPI000824E928|nr:GDCCVxC domain-containing (seleno)protein [Endozoicomonas atrinae]